MAIGTSGYIEPIHLRQKPTKPNEGLHAARMVGAVSSLVGTTAKLYDQFKQPEIQQESGDVLNGLKLTLSNNTAGKSVEAQKSFIDGTLADAVRQINTNTNLSDLTKKAATNWFNSVDLTVSHQQAIVNQERAISKAASAFVNNMRALPGGVLPTADYNTTVQHMANKLGIEPKKFGQTALSYYATSIIGEIPNRAVDSSTYNTTQKQIESMLGYLSQNKQGLGTNNPEDQDFVNKIYTSIDNALGSYKKKIVQSYEDTILGELANPEQITTLSTYKDAVKGLQVIGEHSMAARYEARVKSALSSLVKDQTIKASPFMDTSTHVPTTTPGYNDIMKAKYPLVAADIDNAMRNKDWSKLTDIGYASSPKHIKKLGEDYTNRINNIQNVEQLNAIVGTFREMPAEARNLIFPREAVQKAFTLDVLKKYFDTTEGVQLSIPQVKERIAKAKDSPYTFNSSSSADKQTALSETIINASAEAQYMFTNGADTIYQITGSDNAYQSFAQDLKDMFPKQTKGRYTLEGMSENTTSDKLTQALYTMSKRKGYDLNKLENVTFKKIGDMYQVYAGDHNTLVTSISDEVVYKGKDTTLTKLNNTWMNEEEEVGIVEDVAGAVSNIFKDDKIEVTIPASVIGQIPKDPTNMDMYNLAVEYGNNLNNKPTEAELMFMAKEWWDIHNRVQKEKQVSESTAAENLPGQQSNYRYNGTNLMIK